MRLFVESLSNIDFSYLHPERGLLGETWLADIELEGGLDDQSMVLDFGEVKPFMRKWLDDEIDHKLLVPTQSKHLQLSFDKERAHLSWQYANGTLTCECPRDALCLIDSELIDKTSVSSWSLASLANAFPGNVQTCELMFRPVIYEGPAYHYSHGLKKHGGNCQRIAHGHRSPIEIYKNNHLDTQLMTLWAGIFQDIYIGSQEDVVRSEENDSLVSFHYQAQQGEFFLSLPKKQCYIIDSDSTIECIAQHIAHKLKENDPNAEFRVKAYEGMGKGAIVTI